MASPIPERPLRRPRQAEKPKRNLTSKEQRRKKTEHIVTWGLAFVFAITSVGFMIGFSSDSRGGGKDGPQSQIQVLQERLKAEVDEAAAKPDQPQYRFSQATTYEEMANAALVEGKADDAKAYMAKSVEALRDTLKVSPGHLPALKRLSSRLIGEAKYQDAVDILTAGIKAEKEDLARRRAGAAASPAPSGEPMVQPDTELRSLLFAAYSALSGKDAQAEEVAREGFTLNPREFVRGVGTTVMLPGEQEPAGVGCPRHRRGLARCPGSERQGGRHGPGKDEAPGGIGASPGIPCSWRRGDSSDDASCCQHGAAAVGPARCSVPGFSSLACGFTCRDHGIACVGRLARGGSGGRTVTEPEPPSARGYGGRAGTGIPVPPFFISPGSRLRGGRLPPSGAVWRRSGACGLGRLTRQFLDEGLEGFAPRAHHVELAQSEEGVPQHGAGRASRGTRQRGSRDSLHEVGREARLLQDGSREVHPGNAFMPAGIGDVVGAIEPRACEARNAAGQVLGERGGGDLVGRHADRPALAGRVDDIRDEAGAMPTIGTRGAHDEELVEMLTHGHLGGELGVTVEVHRLRRVPFHVWPAACAR